MKNYTPNDEYYFRYPHDVVTSEESPCTVIERSPDEDIPFIPAEMFDFEALEQSGNLDLFTKNRFSVGSDLDSLDKGIEYIKRSADVGSSRGLSQVSEKIKSRTVVAPSEPTKPIQQIEPPKSE